MKLPEVLTARANIMLDPDLGPGLLPRRDYIEGLGLSDLQKEVVHYTGEVISKLEPGQSIQVTRNADPRVPYTLSFSEPEPK